MSSRLFQELREERALVYDVHSFAAKLRDSGYLGIYLGCEPRRAVEAARVAVDELARLASHPVGADELCRAKEYAKGRLLLHLEGTGAMSQFWVSRSCLPARSWSPPMWSRRSRR